MVTHLSNLVTFSHRLTSLGRVVTRADMGHSICRCTTRLVVCSVIVQGSPTFVSLPICTSRKFLCPFWITITVSLWPKGESRNSHLVKQACAREFTSPLHTVRKQPRKMDEWWNCYERWIVCREWFVMIRERFVRNFFAECVHLGGLLTNSKNFFRCIFSCYTHLQKLRSMTNSV